MAARRASAAARGPAGRRVRALRSLAGLALATLSSGCSRGAASAPPRHDGRTAVAPADAAPRAADATAPDAAPPGDGGPWPDRGLFGRVVPAAEAPPATVLVFRPGEASPLWQGRVDGRNRFHSPDLGPGTYRVVLPGDGVHSTGDLYATVPAADAGPAGPVVVHRSLGCPVTATFRLGEADAGAPPIPGAEVEATMPDLDQVGQGVTLRATTDASGQVRFVGTCVRGFIEGTVRVPGGRAWPFRHGYVGGGWDTFELAFDPAAEGGPAEGGGR